MKKQKFVFSTDSDSLSENLGISKERHEQFFEAAKLVSFRAVIADQDLTSKAAAMEIYLNDVNPETMVEAFLAGAIFHDVFSQTEKIAEKIADAIANSPR